jgi:hypothetical protein
MKQQSGPGGNVTEDVVLDVVDVVLACRSRGQAEGAGAFFRLSSDSSFLTSSPPNEAQYRFESVPTVSTIPTWPVKGVGSSKAPLALQTALTTVFLTITGLQA